MWSKSALLKSILVNSAVRVLEPIVVIESDDWGMMRNESGVSLVSFGVPKFWSEDKCETEQDVSDLLEVLSKYDGVRFTANYIMANPDYDKTVLNDFDNFYLKPLKETYSCLSTVLCRIKAGVFRPQYHGLLHFNAKKWLIDLRKNYRQTRRLFKLKINGGWNNFAGVDSKRYHSEYLQWRDEEEAQIKEWISDGLQSFAKTFGFPSLSTIAPHYIASEVIIKHFLHLGVKYLQGANASIFANKKYVWNGRDVGGMMLMRRNLRLEPSRKHIPWMSDEVIRCSSILMNKNIPIVIDTHRVNYIGKFKKQGLENLKTVLSFFHKKEALFMFSDEFGEALSRDGYYRDRNTGELNKITIIDSGMSVFCKKLLSLWEGLK